MFINKQTVLLTCRKLESPLRCMAKTIYPYCAAKGADVTDWLKKFLPHMKMTSMNMIDMDTSKFEFKEPKVCKTPIGIDCVLVDAVVSQFQIVFEPLNSLQLTMTDSSVQSSDSWLRCDESRGATPIQAK